MNQQYYKEYYELERRHWWFLVRQNILKNRIEKLLNGKKNLQILNIGVATGATSEMLSVFGNVVSLEYDKECYEFTKSKIQLPIILGSILDLPFENQKYDLVCAFDVIEHVQNDDLAISEMKRVCKSSGFVCVTVPAFMGLWSHHDVVNHHFRRYKMKRLSELLNNENNGIVLYKSYFNSLLFLPIYVFRRLSNWFVKDEKRSGSGADNTLVSIDNPINKLMYFIFETERKLLNLGIRFRFGVSAIIFWKKN